MTGSDSTFQFFQKQDLFFQNGIILARILPGRVLSAFVMRRGWALGLQSRGDCGPASHIS